MDPVVGTSRINQVLIADNVERTPGILWAGTPHAPTTIQTAVMRDGALAPTLAMLDCAADPRLRALVVEQFPHIAAQFDAVPLSAYPGGSPGPAAASSIAEFWDKYAKAVRDRTGLYTPEKYGSFQQACRQFGLGELELLVPPPGERATGFAEGRLAPAQLSGHSHNLVLGDGDRLWSIDEDRVIPAPLGFSVLTHIQNAHFVYRPDEVRLLLDGHLATVPRAERHAVAANEREGMRRVLGREAAAYLWHLNQLKTLRRSGQARPEAPAWSGDLARRLHESVNNVRVHVLGKRELAVGDVVERARAHLAGPSRQAKMIALANPRLAGEALRTPHAGWSAALKSGRSLPALRPPTADRSIRQEKGPALGEDWWR
ncbi:hypothetical protein [Yinghuangia aomiensis]